MSYHLKRHSISKSEINDLPLKQYTGTIHMIDSDEKMKAAVRSLGKESVLGFDAETRPAFRRGESYPPSLLQLAASDSVYLFQMGVSIRINRSPILWPTGMCSRRASA
ncbi:MAG: hypothetical protein ABH875_05140 [Candidatus Omnitrophota bacterium]